MGWLVRTRLTSMGLFALLFALLSISGASMSAQSSVAAPAEAQTEPPAANMPSAASVKPPPPADPTKQFAKVLQTVRKRGGRSRVPDYVTSGLGMPNVNGASEPFGASVVKDSEGLRTIYLLDDRDAAVVVSEVGGHVMFYLVRASAGVLKQAAILKSGRLGSKSLQNVPLSAATAGFIVERDFWMETLAAK
jgi:hypothetical protein